MSVQSERLARQIIAITAADPSLKQKEVAAMLDCHPVTVSRALERNQPILEEIDSKLAEVRAKIKERIPIEKRVEVLANIAESSEQDSTRLGAVKYINELDDIHPALERIRVLKADPAQLGDITINVIYASERRDE